MTLPRLATLAGLLAALTPCAWSAQPGPQPAAAMRAQPARDAGQAAVIDSLFARWNQAGAPGAAIVVIRDGKVVLRKAYGMADIERGVKMLPETVFNVGSVTKQFTAFSIHLLAQEGKLSLADDVHRYLPELPDFGKTITLRHLLQHTSGLRDPINLMVLAGWRVDDVVTPEDTLAIIQRQHALNFAPGDEYLYSNAGYNLLAEVVKRVSGKPLAAFVHEKVFAPLGMKHSVFQQDYRKLVPGRALSYEKAPEGGYQYIAESISSVGPGGLLSTVDDLALWDRNFYDAKVGGKELLAAMQETNALNNGKPNRYASGLFIEDYRGRKLVEHSGGIAGYRSVIARYPDERLTVILLANANDLDTVKLGRRVADVFLDGVSGASASGVPADRPAPLPPETVVDPSRYDALVGYYALNPQLGIDVTKEDGVLMGRVSGQQKFRMYPSAEREYFLKVVDARISFNAPGADGVVSGLILHQNGQDTPGARGTAPLPPQAQEYAGEFYSDELHVLYTVAYKDGKLLLTYPRGTVAIDYLGDGKFAAPFPFGQISYQCAPAAGCSGFMVTNGRVRNLQFTKVAVAAPATRIVAAANPAS